ncbi:hypothetical protein ARMGADRAFT_1077786 [Armillaria gallica]|uniref:Uncharacterized protein n=1 Tax=Armillaria gallica TaxID=47427 RepID=A0A2H3DIG6_ARMGA|nr:hypothetical protein ARMGADRAFT_1077786 [Armillaria gallica]
MASLVTLKLNRCYAEPQDFADIVPIVILELHISRCHSNLRFLLGRLTVEDLEVHGPDLCIRRSMHIGLTLRRLTDAHFCKLKRLPLVDTCRDAGYRDLLHLARALERSFSSLEELVLDIPVSQDTHQKILQFVPAFPVLTNSHISLRANETSLGIFIPVLP